MTVQEALDAVGLLGRQCPEFAARMADVAASARRFLPIEQFEHGPEPLPHWNEKALFVGRLQGVIPCAEHRDNATRAADHAPRGVLHVVPAPDDDFPPPGAARVAAAGGRR